MEWKHGVDTESVSLIIASPPSWWSCYSELSEEGFHVGPRFLTKNASFCTLKLANALYYVITKPIRILDSKGLVGP